MKKSVMMIVSIILVSIIGVIFILPDGNLTIGESMILSILLITGILISNKIGEMDNYNKIDKQKQLRKK